MTDQQILLFCGWLIVMAVIIAAALWITRQRQRRLDGIWREFADRRGYAWVEASGPWYRKSSVGVAGAIEGVTFTLDRYSVRTGKSRIVYTRVRGVLPRTLSDKVSVSTRTFVNRLSALFSVGQPAVETGDTSFDAGLIVRSKSRDGALSILDAEARRRLLAFPRSLRLECERHEATLTWRRAETDPANLEAGCGLIAWLCKDR